MTLCKESILLYGPPGAGKTSLGQALADHLSQPFIDLDVSIEARAGKSIPEIFESEGEAAFRRLEKDALREVIKSPGGVVALGGGTLLDPENRVLAESQAEVLCLAASPQTLAERVGQGKSGRPLLDQSPLENLKALIKKRRAHYLSFKKQLPTDGAALEDLVWHAQTALGCFHITGMGAPYEVKIEGGIPQMVEAALAAGWLKPPFMMVMDHHLAALYKRRFVSAFDEVGLDLPVFVFEAGEHAKSLPVLEALWHQMAQRGMERRGTCLAVGGGVTGDLAGFAAATFMRGIAWVNLPTSLLSMVDSSLGGKTGINLPSGKNLAGAFYPPRGVFVDPAFLDTLPLRDFRGGMAEVIKHGVIMNPLLFERCEDDGMAIRREASWLLPRAIGVKARIIVEDPYEQGKRASLNFGHTIGHAVEKGLAYQMSHGEAVSIGMVIETFFAERLGLAEPGLSGRIARALAAFGLPTDLPDALTTEDIMTLIQHDKKKADGRILFALPEAVGRVRVGVVVDDLEDLLEERRM